MAYEDDHFIDTSGLVWNYSFFSPTEVEKFREGTLFNAYDKFGAHHLRLSGTVGFYFSVWAPHAKAVSVIGDFNGWKPGLHSLFVRLDKSGIWEGFLPRITEGMLYKFHIVGNDESVQEKADPFARYAELRPGTASITWVGNYEFEDASWMKERHQHNNPSSPFLVYEVHPGSWIRPEKKEGSFNSYAMIAEKLIPYVKGMGFTHVELLPVMEHPLDGSWGYQVTGYFAPTSRFGNPDELKMLINAFHAEGIGVILDWVPSHFPGDAHGLFMFDGAHTFEYADMRKGYHPDWNSYIFNYRRGEVRSFLLSSAHFWLKQFHADGLRVDAVNSIIRLDFSRKEGEWVPNEHGGNENLEAIEFVKSLNTMVNEEFPDVQTIAEESSDWPLITHPVSEGGYGFGMKWMMGWMHDTLNYFKMESEERLRAQDKLTFSIMYFFDEHFMLPFSHDEVVHGKSPMLYKMPGNEFEKFANLRLLYAYMWMHPGAKLLFMGNEFGQTTEWNEQSELDWNLLQYDSHNFLQNCVRDLNIICRENPALHVLQFEKKGFEWIDISRRDKGLLMFKRKAKKREDDILVLLNVSVSAYQGEEYNVKGKLSWTEVLNTNDKKYWGTGEFLNQTVEVQVTDKKIRMCKIKVDVPALSALIFR